MKKVTIVMPCFNDGKFIHESIKSAKQQTYPNIELIVIDDGSDDPYTLERLAAIDFPDCQLLHTDHVGPAAARNYGIQHARGEYVLPLDADDLIDKTYVEKAVAVMESNENMGIVYCRADKFGCEKGLWDLPDFSFEVFLLDNIIFVSALFRKSDWERIGGFQEKMVHGMEDYDFWLSVVQLGREVYQLPEVLFHYRIKKHSRTTRFIQNIENIQSTYEMIYHNHKELYRQHMDVYCVVLRRALINRTHYPIQVVSVARIPFVKRVLAPVYKFIIKYPKLRSNLMRIVKW